MDLYVDVYVAVCNDVWKDLYVDVYVAVCIDVCIDGWM